MTYVMLRESGGRPIKVKNVEPSILGSSFPNHINTIGRVTFYENYITFTNEFGNEMFVPMHNVASIEFIDKKDV